MKLRPLRRAVRHGPLEIRGGNQQTKKALAHPHDNFFLLNGALAVLIIIASGTPIAIIRFHGAAETLFNSLANYFKHQ